MEIKEEKALSKKAILAFLLSSCLIAAFFAYLYIDLNQKLGALSATSGIFASTPQSPSEIYNEVKDSIVLVEKRKNTSEGVVTVDMCSGFIYDRRHILTVYNLIANASEVRVVFDNKTKVKVEIEGFDEYSNLAVLKIDENTSITQRPLHLGQSDWLHLEEKIHIVGKVCGTENLLLSGEVNGLGISLHFKDNFPLVDVIKFSAAALSLETLGAPLLNSRAEVVGMIIDLAGKNSSITTMGYALSSKMMRKIASSIIENGEYKHLWLKGIWGTDMTQEIAKHMNTNFTRGFLVTYVNSSVSGKLKAGNKTVVIDGKNVTIGGDIIIKIDSAEVAGIYDIVAYLEEHNKKTVKLTVVRNGKVLEKSISWPVDAFSPID